MTSRDSSLLRPEIQQLSKAHLRARCTAKKLAKLLGIQSTLIKKFAVRLFLSQVLLCACVLVSRLNWLALFKNRLQKICRSISKKCNLQDDVCCNPNLTWKIFQVLFKNQANVYFDF